MDSICRKVVVSLFNDTDTFISTSGLCSREHDKILLQTCESLLSSTSEGIKLEISSMYYFSTAVRVEQHNHTSQNHNYDGHQARDVSSGTNIGDRTTGQ